MAVLHYVKNLETAIGSGSAACRTNHALCATDKKEEVTCKKCLATLKVWEEYAKRKAKRV